MRTKEFLGKHNVPFASRNVLEDESALEEMRVLGTRQLPVVSKGKDWVNGQSLKDVARIAGIDLGTMQHLPPAELVRRIDLILEGTSRFFRQFPEKNLDDLTPGRPRSYAQLTYHLFNVVDAWLEHEQGIALTEASYKRYPAPGEMSRDDILCYGGDVQRRMALWWVGARSRTDWEQQADVYYGKVSRHEFLERTTWHSGQHARQLMWILDGILKIKPSQPLGDDLWVGLPMPEQVWDS